MLHFVFACSLCSLMILAVSAMERPSTPVFSHSSNKFDSTHFKQIVTSEPLTMKLDCLLSLACDEQMAPEYDTSIKEVDFEKRIEFQNPSFKSRHKAVDLLVQRLQQGESGKNDYFRKRATHRALLNRLLRENRQHKRLSK